VTEIYASQENEDLFTANDITPGNKFKHQTWQKHGKEINSYQINRNATANQRLCHRLSVA